MNINNKKSLIKSLLSDRLTINQRKTFAGLDCVDKVIRKQWDESGNRIIDKSIKEQIWKKVKARCNQEKKYEVLLELMQKR